MQMPMGAGPELPLVLIVEDANFNLHAERITLESTGYRVINAEEGGSGLLLAKLHHPDLILLDLGLPDMNGRLVIQKLKADHDTRQIPVIVCTADDTQTTVDECRAAGCALMLHKPFSSEQLLDAVVQVLDSVTSGAPAEPDPAA
jgi:CheY-like chemotaxis protein